MYVCVCWCNVTHTHFLGVAPTHYLPESWNDTSAEVRAALLKQSLNYFFSYQCRVAWTGNRQCPCFLQIFCNTWRSCEYIPSQVSACSSTIMKEFSYVQLERTELHRVNLVAGIISHRIYTNWVQLSVAYCAVVARPIVETFSLCRSARRISFQHGSAWAGAISKHGLWFARCCCTTGFVEYIAWLSQFN